MLLQTVTETLAFASYSEICKVAGLLTLAFARLDIKDTIALSISVLNCVHFDCKMFEMKTKHCNCIAKKTTQPGKY